MTDLETMWTQLSIRGVAVDGFVRLRLKGIDACAAYAARATSSGLEALIVEIDTASLPRNVEYAEARGVNLRAAAKMPGRGGSTRLFLLLVEDQFRDVFRALANDIVTKLGSSVTQKEAASTFISRLAHWQRFLREFGHSGLTREQRCGLFGELFFLHDHLLEHADSDEALRSWRGCYGADHDFQFSSGALEVKASLSSTPHSFKVANVSQLDAAGDAGLFLFFVQISEGRSGVFSLNSLIGSIREKLDERSLPTFDECLAAAGYLESQRELYEQPAYSVRSTRFFKVAMGFPRLRACDLPNGVEDLRYSVALAACGPFEVAEPEFWTYLQTFHGGER